MQIDVSGTPHVPLTRLVRVELRKALDTRAGRWLVIAILGLVVVIEVIYAFAADDRKGPTATSSRSPAACSATSCR